MKHVMIHNEPFSHLLKDNEDIDKIKKPFLPSSLGFELAIGGGHLETVKWLISVNSEYTKYKVTEDSLNFACSSGSINMLEYCFLHYNKLPSDMGVNYAALNGHVDVLKFIVSKRKIVFDLELIAKLMYRKQTTILSWYQNYQLSIIYY